MILNSMRYQQQIKAYDKQNQPMALRTKLYEIRQIFDNENTPRNVISTFVNNTLYDIKHRKDLTFPIF